MKPVATSSGHNTVSSVDYSGELSYFFTYATSPQNQVPIPHLEWVENQGFVRTKPKHLPKLRVQVSTALDAHNLITKIPKQVSEKLKDSVQIDT